MGKPSATDADQAAAVWTGNLTSTTAGPWVQGLVGTWNLMLSGTFVAAVILEASFDGGTTVFPVGSADGGGTWVMSAPGLWSVLQSEEGVLHRLRATSHTSGTVACRMSGGRLPL